MSGISPENISGSLGISYGDQASTDFPFIVPLDKGNPIHVLDTHNLEIVLSNLDTITDFVAYLREKEAAIGKYDFISYCGEEDLLAHYFFNFNDEENRHQIGVAGDFNGLMIPEGDWNSFRQSGPYQRKIEADKPSYLWDELIQRTSQNALDGTLIGDGNVFGRPSAIREMAKEPRFHRRFLSEAIISSVKNFDPPADRISRNVCFLPASVDDKGYVFLQVWHPSRPDFDEYVGRLGRHFWKSPAALPDGSFRTSTLSSALLSTHLSWRGQMLRTSYCSTVGTGPIRKRNDTGKQTKNCDFLKPAP